MAENNRSEVNSGEVVQEEKQYGLRESDSYDLAEFRERQEKRNAQKLARKKKAKIKRITFISIVFVLLGLVIFSFTSFFDVDSIEVEGNSYYSDEEIISMGHASPGKSLIYELGAAEIIGYLEQNPYIKKASIHRKLPSTMVIEVEERKELCAIVFDDEYLVIDEDGILLKKTISEPKIPIVTGLVIKKIELGERIECKDEELLEQTLELLKEVNKNDLYFISIDMEGMYIKAKIFDALICKGTYAQMLDAITSGKLHSVLETLFNDGIKRGTITFSDEGYASFEPKI